MIFFRKKKNKEVVLAGYGVNGTVTRRNSKQENEKDLPSFIEKHVHCLSCGREFYEMNTEEVPESEIGFFENRIVHVCASCGSFFCINCTRQIKRCPHCGDKPFYIQQKNVAQKGLLYKNRETQKGDI